MEWPYHRPSSFTVYRLDQPVGRSDPVRRSAGRGLIHPEGPARPRKQSDRNEQRKVPAIELIARGRRRADGFHCEPSRARLGKNLQEKGCWRPVAAAAQPPRAPRAGAQNRPPRCQRMRRRHRMEQIQEECEIAGARSILRSALVRSDRFLSWRFGTENWNQAENSFSDCHLHFEGCLPRQTERLGCGAPVCRWSGVRFPREGDPRRRFFSPCSPRSAGSSGPLKTMATRPARFRALWQPEA